jgi:hypothetical protein
MGGRKGRGGKEGLNELEGKEREKKEVGKGMEFGAPMLKTD